MEEINQTVSTVKPLTYTEALGITINQYTFELGITRIALGAALGCSGPNISNRLRGKGTWPAEDLTITALLIGVGVEDLNPSPDGHGGWKPAVYEPGKAKGPISIGNQAFSSSVAGTGFEPATSGL